MSRFDSSGRVRDRLLPGTVLREKLCDLNHCLLWDSVASVVFQIASFPSPIGSLLGTFGYSDCDRKFTNGCETNTRTSIAHCGQCNKSCADTMGNYIATYTCNAATCFQMAGATSITDIFTHRTFLCCHLPMIFCAIESGDAAIVDPSITYHGHCGDGIVDPSVEECDGHTDCTDSCRCSLGFQPSSSGCVLITHRVKKASITHSHSIFLSNTSVLGY